MEIIKSLDNSHVKYWNKLSLKKYRDKENVFLVEGKHLVSEAIKNNLVQEIILEHNSKLKFDIKTTLVTSNILNKITSLETAPEIMAVVSKKNAKDITSPVLILDDIQDPGNLGTLIRSSSAFGFKTVILSNKSVDLYNPKTIKSTEGMLFNQNILRKDLNEVITFLKQKDYHIYGTNVTGGNGLKQIKPYGNFAVILGNEGQGIKEEILSLCDDFIYIPISSDCESLNVAVAGSIIMYELGDLT